MWITLWITDRRCTTHICLVIQVCSVLLHQLPHQVKVTTYCWHQDSCPAILWKWDWHMHNQSMPLCHILYIPQYIRQCRPDTSVVSTALQYWNIQGLWLQVLLVAIGLHSHCPLHPARIWTHCGASVLHQHGHRKLLATGQCSPTVQGRGDIFHWLMSVYVHCTASMLCMFICICEVWGVFVMSITGAEEGQTSLLDPWGRVMKGRV